MKPELSTEERDRIIHYINITGHKGGYEVTQVAEWLGKAPQTVWVWVDRGLIPWTATEGHRSGRRSKIKIPGDWVKKYLMGEIEMPKRGRPAGSSPLNNW